MWPFSRKRTPEELRRDIETDPDLGPDQKGRLLARLDEKLDQQAVPYDPPRIAQRNQGLFHHIRSVTTAKVQNRRLEEHNRTIKLATETITSLTDARKAWERLQHVDEEIARDRARDEAGFVEDMTARAASHLEQERRRRQAEHGIALDGAQHGLEMEKVEAEREAVRYAKSRAVPEGSATKDEQLRKLRDAFELRRTEKEYEAHIARMEQRIRDGDLDDTPAYYGQTAPDEAERIILEMPISDEEKVTAIKKLDERRRRNRDPEELWGLVRGFHAASS